MLDLIYIAGPPAAGKSTLMRQLTRGCQKVPKVKPFAHQMLVDPRDGGLLGFELGRQREDFPGTDTLGMAVAPVAKRWIAEIAAGEHGMCGVVLGEGDRLGFPGFLDAAIDAAMSVTLVHLTAHPSTLDKRCGLRGSAQNKTWRQGRATKAANLARWAAEHGCKVIEIDSGGCSADVLADSLRNEVKPLEVLPWK